MIKYDTLYHIDENNNIRVWWMERENDKYRTVSGIEGGQLVTSEWKLAKPKNVGKVNATTGSEQAEAEVKSQYTKKLDRKYHADKSSIDSGSKIIELMLADKYKGWNKSWDYVYAQPKLDGMRCIATKDGLFSRQGKPIVSAPHISKTLKPVFEQFPDMIIDGELYNHSLKDNFNELLSIARQSKPTAEDLVKSADVIQYHIYDVVKQLKFLHRNIICLNIAECNKNKCIVAVSTFRIDNEELLDEAYQHMLKEGYEGQMIRINDYAYEHKRSKSLLKRKEFIDEEFEVIEILEGQGNWAGYAKSVNCKTKNGVVFNAGIKGNQEYTKALLNLTPKPKTVTVRYQNMTPDGSLRFPIAVAFYEDKRDI